MRVGKLAARRSGQRLAPSVGGSVVRSARAKISSNLARPLHDERKGQTLRLSVLSSGSSGNATYIETDGSGLLVDAGLSCRHIEGLLARIGRSLDDVGAVLLTHGHADHTSGVRSLVRECGVAVFAAPGVEIGRAHV